MFTADQLVAHAVGDYILQSHWMATEKVKQSSAAVAHAVSYGIPFLFLRPSVLAIVVIISTHFVIDRWRLARWVVLFKNWLCTPPNIFKKSEYDGMTGYPYGTPPWLGVWLLIIADNIMHVLINGLALAWL